MIQNVQSDNLFKTFLSYTIPCIIGMFLTSFITIVDGMFIGWKIGEKGLAAVNLTLPVLYILLAISIMVGVGGITLGSQFLGAKDNKRADYHFSFSLAINGVIVTVLSLGLLVFLDDIIRLLNAKDDMFGYVKDYLGTMAPFYVFMMLNITLSMFIRSEGKPQLSMIFGIAGNILNIILDYLLIIRFDFGMKGAALASGISVIIPFIFGIAYFMSKKSIYKFTRVKFDYKILRTMLFNGSAEFIAQISLSITTYLLNWVILRRIGINGVAALSIVGYVSFIQNMILTGIAIGIHPIISYSFGAKNRETIISLMSIAIKAVLIVGIAAFLLSVTAAGPVVAIFSRGRTEFADIAQYALRLFSASFILNGYNIIAATYFTSLGEAKVAAIISSLRSLILVVVFVLVLPYIIGDAGIWLTAPLTEVLTFAVAYTMLNKSRARLFVSDKGLVTTDNAQGSAT